MAASGEFFILHLSRFQIGRLRLIVRVDTLLGHQTDMGGGGDFDELDAASEDRHGGEDDDTGFDHFSIADEIKAHSKKVKAEENEEPAGDFSSLEHGMAFQIVFRSCRKKSFVTIFSHRAHRGHGEILFSTTP
jgi:hypothetical protein